MRNGYFAKWNSNPESAPYFPEFALLIDRNGAMPGFDRSMAYERFIPNGRPRRRESLCRRADRPRLQAPENPGVDRHADAWPLAALARAYPAGICCWSATCSINGGRTPSSGPAETITSWICCSRQWKGRAITSSSDCCPISAAMRTGPRTGADVPALPPLSSGSTIM